MKARDLSVLLLVIMIVAMLVIPLPTMLLSVLIIVNISLALLVLLLSMNIKEALEFSSFPTLLLILTLFRLGLNVSTTRAILSTGEGGNVVETFGDFVIGGNIIVGVVIFIILVIVQFIVITKGSERVSEVSARFTLDAMPGKQMAIDADLNAGLISEHEAKERREKIAQEADFYGAMDGASKFVKGDAIASIIITLLNISVGFVIGMVQFDMSFGEAAHKFTLLTIGDGIVSQIPALLVSTATGIVVTRSASKDSLGIELTGQMLHYPKLLYVAGGTMMALALFTPLSLLAVGPIAGAMLIGGYYLSRPVSIDPVEETERQEQEESTEMKSQESITRLLQVDPIEFEFGYGLIPLADAAQGGDLLDRIVMIRRQLALELGLIIPVVRIRDNISLQPNEYRLKIKGNDIATGELLLDHYLALSPGFDDELQGGIDTVDPSFGLPAKWIGEGLKDQAEMLNYTIVDPPSVVSTHVTEVLKAHAHELLGREETKALVDHLRETHPTLVEEVTPMPLSIGDVQQILAKLLFEKVSIRNLPIIFETLADYAKMTTDTDVLVEYVRQSLSRQLSAQYRNPDGTLKVLTLAASVEKRIADSVNQTEHGNFLAMDPNDAHIIVENARVQLEQLAVFGTSVVILCSPAVRMYVKQLLMRQLSHIPVLSYNELEPTIEIASVGVVRFDES
ncbi:MAG: flagellar biosynthesis protein FlhA [Bacilli bacterium]